MNGFTFSIIDGILVLFSLFVLGSVFNTAMIHIPNFSMDYMNTCN